MKENIKSWVDVDIIENDFFSKNEARNFTF